LKELSD